MSYIISHCGAEVLIIDPELEEALAGVTAKHKFIIGAESDEVLYKYDVEPQPWIADEDVTATINYTSGTTARPKGVQLTHRNLWVNAAIFGWQLGINDRDVYLHTLPQFVRSRQVLRILAKVDSIQKEHRVYPVYCLLLLDGPEQISERAQISHYVMSCW